MKPLKRYGKRQINPEDLARIRAKALKEEAEGYDDSGGIIFGEKAPRVPDGWNQNNG